MATPRDRKEFPRNGEMIRGALEPYGSVAMTDDAAQPGLRRQDAPPLQGVPDYDSRSVDSNDLQSDFFSAARPVAQSLRDLLSAGIREVEILSCLLPAATQSQRALQAVALAVQALHHMLSAGLFETELMSLLLPAAQPVIQSLRDLLSAGVHQVETLSCLLAARREQQSQRASQAIVLAVQALQKTLTAGLVETELMFLLLPAARQAAAASQTVDPRSNLQSQLTRQTPRDLAAKRQCKDL